MYFLNSRIIRAESNLINVIIQISFIIRIDLEKNLEHNKEVEKFQMKFEKVTKIEYLLRTYI